MQPGTVVSVAVIAINLLLLTWLAFSFFWKASERNSYLAGLGGFLPALLFHVYVTLDFHINDLSGAESFAYFAQWVMAGWVGPLFGCLGFALRRFCFKDFGVIASFLLGFLPCSVFYLYTVFS